MASAPFKVKAIFEYTSSHEDDLAFSVGQIITVVDEEDTEWYGGEYVDDAGVKQEGIFPRNFVEKYEPTAPPRPTRARKKDAEPTSLAPHSPPSAASEQPADEGPAETTLEGPPKFHEEKPIAVLKAPSIEQPRSHEAPPVPVANPPEIAPVPAPAPIGFTDVDQAISSNIDAPPPPSQPKSPPPFETRSPPPLQSRPPPPPAQTRSPPAVTQKPSSNSFKDRIAAFNKSAAPPPAPFKPSGLGSGSSGFIKKPFVAPPPSRHAYVPPPRDTTATQIHRGVRDAEVKEEQGGAAEAAVKAGPASAAGPEPEDEDQPKPTTLKERIALLQKQQAEAASRGADAIGKKEKPVRPPKKRMASNDTQETNAAEQAPVALPFAGRRDSVDVTSQDTPDEQSSNAPRTSTEHPESDGNEAGAVGARKSTEVQTTLTSLDENEEAPEKPVSREGTAPEEQAAGDEEDEEEAEDVDPEVRRKEELRARMAKMSGGMGMAGMFGPPGMLGAGGGLPAKKPKPPVPAERRSSGIYDNGPSSPRQAAPPVPTMMALPGMIPQPQKQLHEEVGLGLGLKQESIRDETTPAQSGDMTGSEAEPSHISTAAPPVPGGRPAPPPIPTDARPPPPPPPAPAPATVASPSVGSESDDEMSDSNSKPLETSKTETSLTSHGPPPIPTMASPPLPTSPQFSAGNTQNSHPEDLPPAPPGGLSQQSNRNSRPPPPIPGIASPLLTHTRPPPPLPPNRTLSSSTADEPTGVPMMPGPLDNGEEAEGTEYEGDYDTDITPSAHHKEALKAHVEEPSVDEDGSVRSPVPESTPLSPSSVLSSPAPRAGPPPIPSQPAPRSGASVDIPRGAPPPPPLPKPAPYPQDDEEYDPYNYNDAQTQPTTSQSHITPMNEEVENHASHQALLPQVPSSADHRPPPSAPPSAPTGSRAPLRKSVDILRPPGGRRSIDAGRHSVSVETGYMANEIDLSSHAQWWSSQQDVPPVFQGRKDIYTESNETNSAEGEQQFVAKETFILFQDYSQTIITVRFDPKDPSQAELDQRHEPPPRPLRQDELEEAYERFGRQLAQSVASKKDSVVGDGTPHALVHELLRPLQDALLPVGTRAYGALVYANLANAATQLNDEIRPGDIISIRNAKFQGKHGPMHAKYTMEVGKPDHVAIVAEWDGTKKKVRAWEQGRGTKKVKQESYKLEDLRSGEVKIWRVMPRTWIGWSLKD